MNIPQTADQDGIEIEGEDSDTVPQMISGPLQGRASELSGGGKDADKGDDEDEEEEEDEDEDEDDDDEDDDEEDDGEAVDETDS